MRNDKDLEDIAEEGVQLGNYHIEVPEEMQYMVDQFNTFATKDINGEPANWLVSPKIVRDWMIRFGKVKFKEGHDNAFEKVVDIIGSNMNKETREALTFLINEQ